MNLERVKKKLREARFFLSRMQDEEKERFLQREPLDFYMSAFLNAGYSVNETLVKYEINQLPIKERRKCIAWLDRWKQDALTPQEKGLIKFVEDDRGKEVHREGSRRKGKIEQRELVGTHLDHSSGSFGTDLCILKLGDTSTATGRLMFTVIGAIACFERELMLETQREGIAKAKAEGKYRRRKPTARARAAEIVILKADGVRPVDIARRLGIGRASVYRVLAA
jgi:resolvase-like protein/helix-turn-helix resolvase-like protein